MSELLACTASVHVLHEGYAGRDDERVAGTVTGEP